MSTDVSQQQVLDLIYGLFLRHGTWPVWSDVDHELNRRFEITNPWSAVENLDRSLMWGVGDDEPRDMDSVGVRVAGLAMCPAAGEDLAIFIRSLQYAAALEMETPARQDAVLTPGNLVENVRLPAAGRAEVLMRQAYIWQAEFPLHRGFGLDPAEQTWSVTLNGKAMRRMRAVRTVADYQEALEAYLHPEPRPQPVGRSRPAEIRSQAGELFTYSTDEELGSGGQGRVFAGRGPGGDRVAVKVVSLRSHETEAWARDVRHAEREWIVANELRQASVNYVLPVLGHALTDDAFIIITPRASFSLEEVVQLVAEARGVRWHGRPAPAEARRRARGAFGPVGPTAEDVRGIVVDLARGLVELAEHQVLHRDIKPANALWFDHRWVWSDLGIARLAKVSTATYTFAGGGSHHYQAPEVLAGESASPQSDVYALGCTLHALLYGRPPFVDDTGARHRAVSLDVSDVEDITFKQLLTHCLAASPGARPSAHDVVRSLTHVPTAHTARAQRVHLAAQRREADQAAETYNSDAHALVAQNALARFAQIWDALSAELSAAMPGAASSRRGGEFMFTMADRRLVVNVEAPASVECPALQLGVVGVQFEGSHRQDQSWIANIYAGVGPAGSAQWRLLRMVRNDLAPDAIAVPQALSDGLGGISVSALEKHLLQTERRVAAKAVTTASEEELTADALIGLMLNEMEAIDASQHGRPAGTAGTP